MTAAAIAPPRATELERRRLNDDFEALCRIASPSGEEAGVALWLERELGALGLEVRRDRADLATGGDAPNLLVRIPATGADREPGPPSVLLCAHMDTVAVDAPLEPVVVDGAWCNANNAIIGADNKAAVAVLLGLARRSRVRPLPVPIELLFTVSEERGLLGAREFDVSALRSSFGYVFDHDTPIGEIVVAAPSHYHVGAELSGAAAHAGIRPEDGRSAIVAAARAVVAMPSGRLDEETTANVGTIEGGNGATNVVAHRCRVLAEARSLDDLKAERVAEQIVAAIHDAANRPECACDVDVVVERLFEAYRVDPDDEAVRVARRALIRCGYRVAEIVTGGGSDANALRSKGFQCVNLANGTENDHRADERVSIVSLEGMLDVALTLLEEAAAV